MNNEEIKLLKERTDILAAQIYALKAAPYNNLDKPTADGFAEESIKAAQLFYRKQRAYVPSE